MWSLTKKEFINYFTNLSASFYILGYLLILGFILFINPSTNLFDFGYANLDFYFQYAPWLLIILCSILSMNSVTEEYNLQTIQHLFVWPISYLTICWSKFLGIVGVLILAIVPTLFYPIAIQSLSSKGGIDWAATTSSFVGLFFLGCCFLSLGLLASALSKNSIISFILAVFFNIFFFKGFDYIGNLLFSLSPIEMFLQKFSLSIHYQNIQYGLINLADILFFSITIYFNLFVSSIVLSRYEV